MLIWDHRVFTFTERLYSIPGGPLWVEYTDQGMDRFMMPDSESVILHSTIFQYEGMVLEVMFNVLQVGDNKENEFHLDVRHYVCLFQETKIVQLYPI